MVRFLRGYVRLEAEGGYPERFLSRAAEAGIPLWDTARRGVSLFACCPSADYRRLRPIARKSGVRMRVIRRRGLPFLLRPLRTRWGVAVGAVLALVLLQILSSRIWVITVEGNDRLPDEAILQVLEPLGVYIGGDFDKVDVSGAQLTALQQLPELGWLAVNQSGSVVEVRVREREETLPVEDKSPANIVAACDGVVVAVEVTGGQAMVKAGDAVTAGTLLISGVTDSKVGPLLRRASGSVTARVTVTLTAEVPLREPVTVDGDRVVRPSLTVFGLRLPLYTNSKIDGKYTESYYERLLTAGERVLPFGWTVTELVFARESVVERDAAAAMEEARQRLAQTEQERLAGMTVEQRQVFEECDGERAVVTGVYTVVREIGVVRPIGVQ